MISSLLIQLIIPFIAEVSGAVINVCDLPRDRRQQLNVSCNFNTKEGCTVLYTSKPGNFWKYETKEVGNKWNGGITGDHNTSGSGGYYLFQSLNVARGDRDQLLTPFLPYNNICLRFWYNLPYWTSNIQVLANNKQLFSRNLSKTLGWEQKNISISLEMQIPIQIAFESHKATPAGMVGIDDVVIEIEGSASKSTLSPTTTLRTLKTSLRNASSITNSTKTATHLSITSTVITTSLSKTTNPTTTKLSTTRTTPVTRRTAKTFTTVLNAKSATTATQNILSTPRATVTPTKTSTTITSATTKSVRTTETPIKTSTTTTSAPTKSIRTTETPMKTFTTRATTFPISIRSTSPTTTIVTTLTTTATTTRFKSSTLTTQATFTKPSTTGTANTITISTSTPASTTRATPTTTPTKTPTSVTKNYHKTNNHA